MTDVELVLSRLKAAHGDWVTNLYGETHTMVHSRVAELRRRGYFIECQRFGQGDYRYRLVAGTSPGSNYPEEPRHQEGNEW